MRPCDSCSKFCSVLCSECMWLLQIGCLVRTACVHVAAQMKMPPNSKQLLLGGPSWALSTMTSRRQCCRQLACPAQSHFLGYKCGSFTQVLTWSADHLLHPDVARTSQADQSHKHCTSGPQDALTSYIPQHDTFTTAAVIRAMAERLPTSRCI